MRKFFFILLIPTILTSCSKYEENKGIHLRSKEKRLIQKWDVENRIDQQGNQGIGATRSFEFKENGDAYLYRTVIYLSIQDTISWIDTCKWSWLDDKERILLDFNNLPNDFSYEMRILRLEKNHLWFEWYSDVGEFTALYECIPNEND